jgi:hypothetical protein
VVIAGDQGICFYEHRNLGGKPVAQFLKGIKFKQVVCSEKGLNSNHTIISIFAVSDRNDLYFVRGTRFIKENRIQWISSGLPIRKGVARVSTQFNKERNTCDVLFIGNGSNELYHLSRDEKTTLWSETRITFLPKPDPANVIDQPVTRKTYLTTLTFTDANGSPVPASYPVNFTSEPVFIIANERTYTFDMRPTEITTDSKGRITIAIEPDPSLRAPLLQFSLPQYAKNDNGPAYTVYPAQRVMHQLGRFQTPEELKSATTSDGRQLFPKGIDEDRLKQSSQLMSQMPAMLRTVDSNAAQATLPPKLQTLPLSKDDIVSVEKSENSVKPAEGSWFTDAMNSAKEFVGDVIEHIKQGFKEVCMVVLKVVGPVLRLAIKIFDKVLDVVIDGVAMLLSAANTLIKDLTGIDLGELFGFAFNVEKIKETQDVSGPSSQIKCRVKSLRSRLTFCFRSTSRSSSPSRRSTRIDSCSKIEALW